MPILKIIPRLRLLKIIRWQIRMFCLSEIQQSSQSISIKTFTSFSRWNSSLKSLCTKAQRLTIRQIVLLEWTNTLFRLWKMELSFLLLWNDLVQREQLTCVQISVIVFAAKLHFFLFRFYHLFLLVFLRFKLSINIWGAISY